MIIVRLFLALLAQTFATIARIVDIPSHFRHLAHRTNNLYYRLVQYNRRRAGEPEWQEHDIQIGKYPPPDHPFWESRNVQPIRIEQ